MKTHTIQYNTSIRQGYHPMKKEKGHSAELYENNNRGYSVAFSGSGASKIEEAAAKRLSSYLKPYIKPVINKLDKDNLFVDPDFLGEIYAKTLNEKILSNPKKYPYGLKGGLYPEYKEGFEKTFLGKLIGSKAIDKATDFFHNRPSVAQAFMALFVAGMMRPATNLAMAGKNDKEDSIYAATHAIASAVVGYIASSTILAPFDAAFKDIANSKKIKRHLKGKEKLLNVYKIGPRAIETSSRWSKLADICKFSFDSFFLGIPKAMLTIALIPPILKYGFGLEKKSKQPAVKSEAYSQNFVNKDAFLGGVK